MHRVSRNENFQIFFLTGALCILIATKKDVYRKYL